MSHLVLRGHKWAAQRLWQFQSVIAGVRSNSTDTPSSKQRSASASTLVNRPRTSPQTRAAVLPEPSYQHGACPTPLLGVTIGQRLEWAAERVPEREAIVFCKRDVRLTFAQYLQKADSIAAGLLALGVKRGDRVGLWGVNSPEWVLSHAGALRAGGLVVNLHPGYRPAEVEYTLNKAEASVLLVERSWRSQDYVSILCELAPELLTLKPRPGPLRLRRLPHLRHIVLFGREPHPGMHSFVELAQLANSELLRTVRDLQRRIQIHDPAQMMFTSGTTGNPKGALLSHHSLINDSYFMNRRLGYAESDPPTRICCPLPFYHTFGNTLVVLSMASSLNTVVVPSEFFHAEDTLRAVQAEKCNALHGTPTMLIDLLHHPRLADYDLSSLRTSAIGGAPVPVAVARAAAEKLHVPLAMVGYGATETTCCCYHTYPTDSLEKRVGTVGRVMDHMEAKLVDEEGNVVPRGGVGEVLMRGFAVMLGYWRDDAKTREVLGEGGWLRTGDLGRMDPEGYMEIVGRLKDLIIRGGSNVYPVEVEQVLHQNPAVQEVQVVGVPDERLGEEVCAFVRVKKGLPPPEKKELIAFCKERLSHYKAPAYVLFVGDGEEFPRTASGKVQKYRLREMAVRALGLDNVQPHMEHEVKPQ